jgi:flavin-dependent dehydrogenase
MTSVVRKYDVGIVGSGPVGLVLSSLLSHYGVNHVLIERRLHPVVHPQAHFLNARTMEILQLYCPKAHNRLLKQLQNSDAWRYEWRLRV